MIDGIGEQDQRGIIALDEVRHFQETTKGLSQTNVDNGFGDGRNGGLGDALGELGVPGTNEPEGLCEFPVTDKVCSVLRRKVDIGKDLIVIQDVVPIGFVRVGVDKCLDHLRLMHYFYGLGDEGVLVGETGRGS